MVIETFNQLPGSYLKKHSQHILLTHKLSGLLPTTNKEIEFQSKWQSRQTLCSPLCTTPKLQLNYRTATLETTWRLTEQKYYNKGYIEEATLRLVRGVKTWLHSCMWQNHERYLCCRGSPEEQGFPVPHWALQPRARLSRDSAWVRQRAAADPDVLLKGPAQEHWLTCR